MRNRLASAFAPPLAFSAKLLLPLSVLGMSACTLAPDLPTAPLQPAEYYKSSQSLAALHPTPWPNQAW